MQTKIYFVRHGHVKISENIWYGRLAGYSLSEKGKQQIRETAMYLKKQPIDLLYSSPLERTRQTAEIINDSLQLPQIHFSDNLLEVDSSLAGKSLDYLNSIQFDIFATPGGSVTGETVPDLAKRMKRFVNVLSTRHAGQNIVAVSHGDPIMILRTIIDKNPLVNESLRPKDGSYIVPGEVYLLTVEDNILKNIVSVFKPTIT